LPTDFHSFPTRRSSDLAIPAYCLSANAPSLHYNLSRAGAVTGNTAYPAAASSLCKSSRADKNAGRDLENLQNRFVARCRRLRGRSEEHTSELQSRFDLV